jgi:hypothetical protein
VVVVGIVFYTLFSPELKTNVWFKQCKILDICKRVWGARGSRARFRIVPIQRLTGYGVLASGDI